MDHRVTTIFEKLKEVARNRSLTNYNEVGRLVGLNMASEYDRIRIAQLLDEINQLEVADDRPMITALVILKNENIPGEGFFKCAIGLGKYDGSDDDSFWAQEVERVYTHWVKN
jgi:hypothetical protein